jgi:MFS family permease
VLTVGFALGAAVAAAIAQSGTAPEVLPYLVNVVLCALALTLMWSAPEHARRAPRSTARRPPDPGRRSPGSVRRRPLAPWVFGTAASAYAILPVLFSAQVPGFEVGFAGLLCLIALGCGVAAQSLVRRIDRAGSARTIVTSFAATTIGLALAAGAAVSMSLPVAIIAAAASARPTGSCW